MSKTDYDNLYNRIMVFYFEHGYSFKEAHEKTLKDIEEACGKVYGEPEEKGQNANS